MTRYTQKFIQKIAIAQEILSFTDPREALEHLNAKLALSRKRVLVLVDINMPETGGFGFPDSASLLRRNGNVPDIIMASSSIARADIEKGPDNNLVSSYISKTLTGIEVLNFIKDRSPLSA